MTLYRCEMRGATVLRRSGWTPEMFVVGARITVQGAPDRVDPHLCYVNTLVLADGRTLDRYTQRAVVGTTGPSDRRPIDVGPAATSGAGLPRMSSGVPNLAGAWAVEQQLMTDPRGRLGTLVPASIATQFAPGARAEAGHRDTGVRGLGGARAALLQLPRRHRRSLACRRPLDRRTDRAHRTRSGRRAAGRAAAEE